MIVVCSGAAIRNLFRFPAEYWIPGVRLKCSAGRASANSGCLPHWKEAKRGHALLCALPCRSMGGRFEEQRLADHRLHGRSEEHTSELQSRGHLVCRLLLEKKK